MELELLTDMNQGLQAIDFNYEAIKGDLAQKLEKYQGLVVTEDGVKEAKKDRAMLNSLKKALDEKRIATKKQYLAPFEAFECKVKELVSLVDKPVAAIDAQIKAFEQQENEKKETAIKAFFADSVGALEGLVTFGQFFNPRWLNASYKMDDIKAEIATAISHLKDNVQIIKEMGLAFEQEVLNVLFTTLDLAQALKKKTALEEQQARMAAAKIAEEERITKAQVQAQFEAAYVYPPSPAPCPKVPQAAPVAEKECNVCISVYFRESQRGSILMLLQTLDRLGIRYETAE